MVNEVGAAVAISPFPKPSRQAGRGGAKIHTPFPGGKAAIVSGWRPGLPLNNWQIEER